MGGAIVTDPVLCQAPNDNNKCPAGTDLAGAYVMNPASDCTIFATCDAGTALGIALGMQNEFKVSDPVLCDLEVPPATELFVCTEPDGPMAGAIVTDLTLCQAPNNNNKCPVNSDLPGVYVMDPQTQCEIAYDVCDASTPLGQALGLGAADIVEVADGTLCFLSVPEAVQLFECEADDTLGAGALVTDQQLCNALVQEVAQCEDGPLQGVFVDPADAATTCTLEDVVTNCPMSVDNPMGGQLVTTVLLCNAPVDAEKCPAQNDDLSPTDLPGVYTMMPSQCNIDYPVCDSTTPLGIALELGVTEEVEVVDDALCQLPFAACEADTVLGEGTIVTDLDLCNVPTDAVKCEGGNIFDGFYVMEGMVDELCNLNAVAPFTTTCDDNDPLPISLGIAGDEITILDEDICQTSGVVECQNGTPLADADDIAAGTDVNTFVTDSLLCNVPTDAVKCEGGNIFDGFYVMEGMVDELCNLNAVAPFTTTCDDNDPLPISLGIAGDEITILDEDICQTSGVVECQNGTPLADADDIAAGTDVNTFVSSASLCNAITSSDKNSQDLCEICILIGLNGINGDNPNAISDNEDPYGRAIPALNTFNGTSGQGIWGICNLETNQDIRDKWAEIINDAQNCDSEFVSCSDRDTGAQAISFFNACMDSAGLS